MAIWERIVSAPPTLIESTAHHSCSNRQEMFSSVASGGYAIFVLIATQSLKHFTVVPPNCTSVWPELAVSNESASSPDHRVNWQFESTVGDRSWWRVAENALIGVLRERAHVDCRNQQVPSSEIVACQYSPIKGDISKTGFFIYLLIRIFLRKPHHHTSRRSDDLPSQKYVLQSERLDLLPVFCFPNEVHLQ